MPTTTTTTRARATTAPRARAKTIGRATTRDGTTRCGATRARDARDDAVSRRRALALACGAVVARPIVARDDAARAMFNADLDKPIEDGPRAIAVTLAARAALADVLAQNDAFRDTCEAPVFACDLSQLNVKTSSRVSGPLRRSLPTLSEMYGADPYAVDSVLQNVSTLEAIFKANNARVKVDFKGGPEMIGLINQGLEELYNDLPADALAAGRAVFEACDLAVDATAEGDLECRIARAVSQNKRPSGGQS